MVRVKEPTGIAQMKNKMIAKRVIHLKNHNKVLRQNGKVLEHCRIILNTQNVLPIPFRCFVSSITLWRFPVIVSILWTHLTLISQIFADIGLYLNAEWFRSQRPMTSVLIDRPLSDCFSFVCLRWHSVVMEQCVWIKRVIHRLSQLFSNYVFPS